MHIKKYLKSVLLITYTGFIAISNPVLANTSTDSMDSAVVESPEFKQCVELLAKKASENGISASVVNQYQEKAEFIPRVIELDRKQPEFTETFANYVNRRVTDFRIEKGQELLKQHDQLLHDLQKSYGVPGRYLVAFWGLETNYGRYTGKMSTLNSLTTLACDPRRSQYFTDQLIAALTILDRRSIVTDELQGSWAGALGNMQFMPSVFLQHAQDGDDDGVIDLWGSVPDALTSAAAFLKSLGWTANERWGREVLLPEGFPYEEAGLYQPKSLSEWRKLGLKTVFGGSIPKLDIEAALVIPAGHQGPKFLVYSNFHTIMGWNRSEFYALAVGHLSDRLIGFAGFKNPPPEDAPRLSKVMVEKLQTMLIAKGFDAGEPDGIFGPQTRQALRQYQSENEMIADGYPNKSILLEFNLLNQEDLSP